MCSHTQDLPSQDAGPSKNLRQRNKSSSKSHYDFDCRALKYDLLSQFQQQQKTYKHVKCQTQAKISSADADIQVDPGHEDKASQAIVSYE